MPRRHEHSAVAPPAPKRPSVSRWVQLALALALGSAATFALGIPAFQPKRAPLSSAPVSSTTLIEGMLGRFDERLDGLDIARMNFACAAGLPGAESLDVD